MTTRQATSTQPASVAETTNYDAQLWRTADALRGSMDASEYKHVVLGLIFLKYISDAFEEVHARLERLVESESADAEDPDEYRADGIFWVPREARWVSAQAPGNLYITAITAGEVRYGASLQRRRQPEFAALLERWLETVMTLFSNRILPFDEAAAGRWGLLHAELGYTNSDLQIAAIALSRGFTVVTHNIKDYKRTGVSLLEPSVAESMQRGSIIERTLQP